MTRERKVTEGLRKLAAGDDLGWYTTLLIDAGARSANEPEALARTIRMGAVGLLDATTVARVLVRVEEVDIERVVRLLDRKGAASHSRREVWQAMCWCGEPGAARLERAVIEEADPDGAAGLLAELDLDRAVEAIRQRVVVHGRPVHAADARPLEHLTDTDVAVLAGRLGPERLAAEPDAARPARGLLRRASPGLGVVAARAVLRPDLPLAGATFAVTVVTTPSYTFDAMSVSDAAIASAVKTSSPRRLYITGVASSAERIVRASASDRTATWMPR